jgi:hypothetical protein
MSAGLEGALGRRRAIVVVLVVVMAVASTSIAVGFLTDDHVFRAVLHSTNEGAPRAYDLFRFVPGDVADNQQRIRFGHLPWWSSPDLQIHFLRPVTSLAFAADDWMFGRGPLGYHLVSLAWYLALLIAAAAVFRRLLPAPAATLALAVFGLSAAHVEAYAWISARHVVIAGAFAAAALAARWSRRRWLAPLVLVAALASSEAALAVVPIWIALELSVTARPWRARLRSCLPVTALSIGYLVVYAALGAGTRGSGGYLDPMSDPLGFAGRALVRVPLLVGDAALGIPAELSHVVGEGRLAIVGLAAAAVVVLAWWLTGPAPSGGGAASQPEPPEPPPGGSPSRSVGVTGPAQRRTVLWLAIGGIGGTLLGVAGYPAGRVLVIPDLAFAAVLGLVLYRGLLARWPGRSLALVLVLAHLVLAPLGVVRTVQKLERRAHATRAIAERIVQLAPPSGRLFVVAASDPMVFLYPRGIASDLAPGAVRCWSVLSAARASHRVTRTSEHRLTIEPIERPLLDGSFDQLFRAADRPFSVGDSVVSCGARIGVAAVRQGLPARLEVTLRQSLDDPEVVLLVWRDHQLERFTPPRIGETVELPWSPGPGGFL